jgi:uncharacterized membrane-anchored protein YitT (DUF2179 family)
MPSKRNYKQPRLTKSINNNLFTTWFGVRSNELLINASETDLIMVSKVVECICKSVIGIDLKINIKISCHIKSMIHNMYRFTVTLLRSEYESNVNLYVIDCYYEKLKDFTLNVIIHTNSQAFKYISSDELIRCLEKFDVNGKYSDKWDLF